MRIWIDEIKQARKITPLTAIKLSSLLERDETPDFGTQSNLDTIVSSPTAPPNTAATQRTSHFTSSTLQTPSTAGRLYPSLEEMHPSKVQQSTTKQPDSGLRLGFKDIKVNTETAQKRKSLTLTHETPCKPKGNFLSQMSSSDFEFRFTRPESDLSAEARNIMESVREQAATIKAEMVVQRDEQNRKDEKANGLRGIGGRKIAKPKGKAGRFSDVHMAEFKKMDSIAGHASAWKAQPGRFQPVQASLKRSKSRADLDDHDKELSQAKSSQPMTADRAGQPMDRTASVKRLRQLDHTDTSRARPISRDESREEESNQSTPRLPKPQSGLPTAVTTPTKASLARAASVKHPKTSMIPSLARSNSTKTIGSPAVPRTEGGSKYFSSLSRFGSMKSILHRSRPLFSDDPVKVAAGTHLPTPQGKTDLNKDLPSLPGNPSGGLQRSPTLKRVDFTPGTKSRYELAAGSPSPSKIPAPHLVTRFEPSKPTIEYPVLPHSATPSPDIGKQSKLGSFTFQTSKTVDFGPATSGIKDKTIRHVRPSGVSTPLAPFENLPVVPHGMPNKKRRREESVDEDAENKNAQENGEEGPKSKRVKGGEHWKPSGNDEKKKDGKRGMTGSRIPRANGGKEKGRGILSLSRLNMLARPKERR